MSHAEDPYDAFHVVHPLYLKGVQREQERIIALLDESLIYDEPVVIERERLIALIKEKFND